LNFLLLPLVALTAAAAASIKNKSLDEDNAATRGLFFQLKTNPFRKAMYVHRTALHLLENAKRAKSK
jgi:hypothetical protein